MVLTSMTQAGEIDREASPGVEVARVPASHILERRFFIPFPLFSPRLFIDAYRRLRQADVVHIHDVFYISSWVVTLMAAAMGKPIVLTQHVALVEHASQFVMWIQRLVYATFGKFIFRRAALVVAYNANVRDFLIERGVPERCILFLANGIDIDKFHPAAPGERHAIRERFGLPQDRALVLFVGRLVEKKGVRLLLKAKDSRFDLVFVGPGPIPEGGPFEGIHWLGSLDQMATAEVYRACDLFAFPAIGEVLTLAMQESMASGLPVVTTNDAAYLSAEVSEVLLLCPRHADNFREAICALLADPERLRSLGTQSRSFAIRHFDWNVNFASLMNALNELIVGRFSSASR